MAVIDAGSTGSRLHIYRYALDEKQSPVNIQEIFNQKINPGISTLNHSESSIDHYFNFLFKGAPEGEIPVYLYATAGMRLIPKMQQDKIYTLITHWFNQHPAWPLYKAKTITGQEEAIFDWLAINYITDENSSVPHPPVGVMDMGGASVQIVLPVEQQATSSLDNDLVHIQFKGQAITLFAHSFLGLGMTEVSHQFLNDPNCFPEGFTLPDGLVGHGDAYQCSKDITKLINHVQHVDKIVKNIVRTTPNIEWFTIGGLSYFAGDTVMTQESSQQFTLHHLIELSHHDFCQQEWGDSDENAEKNELSYQYCLLGAYYYSLITKGYGIDKDTPIHLFSKAQNTDWTLGVVLHQE